MSGISSGVGLISGLPTASIIEQLLAIEARPLNFVKARIQRLQAERTAFSDLTARLLAVKNAVAAFDQPSFFNVFKAASSNPNVLTAVAGETAVTGSYTFSVLSLASRAQLIGAGRADADSTPVGAGTFTVEVGGGGVNRSTLLASLNGGAGISRGKIKVTDRNGASTELDLRHAITVDDVLDAFNNQSAVAVNARVSGDRLIVEDQSGGTGELSIADLAGGQLASSLGLAGNAGVTTQLQSDDLIKLVDGTQLSQLNDGNGIDRATSGGDFDITVGTRTFHIALDGFLTGTTRLEVLNSGQGVRLGTIKITDRSGASAEIDLSQTTDIGDVIAAINAADIGVDATYTNSRLQLNDTTGATTGNLKVEDVSGFAATDLGIKADVAQPDLLGSNIYRISTVGDVIRAINFAVDANGELNDVITARIADNGNGLTLDSVSPFDPATITAVTDTQGNTSEAAADLGLLGEIAPGLSLTTRDLTAGLNTVLLSSLKGGQGVNLGAVSFTARDGTASTIDFAGAQTLQDVIDRINETSASSKIAAEVNPVGNGILIKDLSGGTANPLTIADLNGTTTAADLGIAGSAAAPQLNGGNLQLQYISKSTKLSDLNNGAGVNAGQFKVTPSNSAAFTVSVGENQKTVGDLIQLINAAAPPGVTAAINDRGDGIVIRDETGGQDTLRVDEVGGGTAADLNLAGVAASGQTFIDGSYETTIELDADDTLNDLVAKLTQSGANVTASIINDGSGVNPYRLNITSGASGRKGYVLLDSGSIDLGLQTLVEGRDAVIALGSADAPNPILITSAGDTLTDVIPGVTINLVGADEDPVTVNVTQDVDSLVKNLQSFVTNYNAVLDRIDELTKFNAETNERGVLLGDATVSLVEDRLFRTVSGPFAAGSSTLSRLSAIGVSSGTGGRLTFDEDEFRAVYGDNPAAVEGLFTAEGTGVGDVLETVLDDLTRSGDSVLARKDETLGDQEELLNDRAESLQALLDRKRVNLTRRFQSLETALASLQAQQSALVGLTQLAASLG